ncbi:MAG: hypothetical protein QMD13_01965 [Candidatus Bathyarchaeia archaeon]|nr:hypothetical protein [Candidatus Bathyarchaeia archaeon]
MKIQTVEERKALILIEFRGYKLIRREEQEDVINFMVKLRGGKRQLLCAY